MKLATLLLPVALCLAMAGAAVGSLEQGAKSGMQRRASNHRRVLTAFEKTLETNPEVDGVVANITRRAGALRFPFGGPQLGGQTVRGVSIGGW